MSIRLTILGKSPSWQDRDGACSGYLVEVDAGPRLLIDCGSGVFGKLRRHGEFERIDAVLISHLHADHLLDLVPFAYALTYGPQLRACKGIADGSARARDEDPHDPHCRDGRRLRSTPIAQARGRVQRRSRKLR